MADEPVTIRGGSMIIECDHGNKQLVPDTGNKHKHPSKGKITHVEIREKGFTVATVYIKHPTKNTEIEIHYDV